MKSCAMIVPTQSATITAALNRRLDHQLSARKKDDFAKRTHLGKITTNCKPKRSLKPLRRFGAQNEPILSLTNSELSLASPKPWGVLPK